MSPENANLESRASLRSGYELDLKEKKIALDNATRFRVFALIRKKSCGGIFGWIYFLERRKRAASSPHDLFLFGGRIEYRTEEIWKDATPRAAIAREINEEIGEEDEFGGGHFDEFASIYGKSENGEMAAVDIYTLQDSKARWLTKKYIKKCQAVNRRKLADKREELLDKGKRNYDPKILTSLQAEIEELEGSVDAGEPIKVRYFLGLWIRSTLTRTTLNWSQLSPFAAYALSMDRRQRQS